MINGQIVVDHVVHPFDYGEENLGNGRKQVLGGYKHHRLYNRRVAMANEDYLLRQEEWISDFPPDAMTHALFAESLTDFAIVHSLPNLGFTKGVVSELHRMAKLRETYSNRYLLYGWVNTLDLDQAIKDLEMQVNEIGIDGLKCFPSLVYDGKHTGWRMDDPKFAIPLFEAAHDLGIRNIAVHKALPMFGPTPLSFFKVDDLDVIMPRFPDINFYMIHAGMGFLEETTTLMHRFPNFHANLESTIGNVVERPRVFAEVIGEMIYHGSADQIVYGSGCNLVHPQPLLEAFAKFQMPEDLMEQRGYLQITDEMKAKILGLNVVRTHNLDASKILEGTKGDQFDQVRSNGIDRPWTALRREEYAADATGAA
ncbi:amidohydrolase family protein [Streptomyces sp. NPDC002758]